MKNKKQLLILYIFLGLGPSTHACDMCGCYMGILPRENESSIAVLYRYRAFTSQSYKGNSWFPDNGNARTQHNTHSASGDTSSYSNSFEIYRVAELRGKYYIHPKIDINIILPYLMNSDADGAITNRLQGMGDLTIFSSYELLNNSIANLVRQRMQLGAGFKLPLGEINNRIDGKRVSLLMQSGTGSTDILFYGSYTLGYRNFGTIFNLNYKLNGSNSYHEKIANSFTSFSSVFYKCDLNSNVTILPNFQSYYENSKGLLINEIPQEGTTMNVWMVGGGLDFHYKQFGISASMQLPIAEKLLAYQPKSTVRTIFSITWHFANSKYLFSSKVIDDDLKGSN